MRSVKIPGFTMLRAGLVGSVNELDQKHGGRRRQVSRMPI